MGKKIVVNDDEGVSYPKFLKLGDELKGVYQGKEHRPAHTNEAGQVFRESYDYIFKTKAGKMVVSGAPASLVQRFERAEEDGDLKEKVSYCIMKFTSDKPLANGKTKKIVELEIDNEIVAKHRAAKAAGQSQPPAPPPPPPQPAAAQSGGEDLFDS